VGKLGFRTVALARPSLLIYYSLESTVADGKGSSTDLSFVIRDFRFPFLIRQCSGSARSNQHNRKQKNDKWNIK